MPRTNEFGQPIGDVVDWTPPPMPGPVALAGRYVVLEPLVSAHAPALLERLAPHPDLWTYLADEPPADLAEATGLIERRNAMGVPFALLDPVAGVLLGMSMLMSINLAVGSIEVGAVLYGPDLQRSRAATEAQYLLMKHAFGLGFRRYEWKCDSLNEPSRKAAARLGFVEEGTFRNAVVYKGRNRDTTWFSVTDAEWPVLRAGFEAWLDPANFDEAGRQHASLVSLRTRSVG